MGKELKSKVIINDIEFEVELKSDETILESCLRARVGPSYSCLEGVCSFCEAEISEGSVKIPFGFETDLHPKTIKTCKSLPVSKTVNLKYLKKT